MEYKLSKSEFYRIGYLLAGLFLFLFLFGIFNLSSYASSFGLGWTSSTTNLKKANPIPTDTSGTCTVSFGTPSFTVNIPADPSLSQATSTTFSYSYEIYITTTSGTFMVKTGISTFTTNVYPSQVNTFTSNLSISNVGSYTLDGQFISADLKIYYDNDFVITDNSNINAYISGSNISGYTYGSSKLRNNYFGISSVNSSFVIVRSNLGSSSASSFYPDYSSYNYAFLSTDLNVSTAYYGTDKLLSGSPIDFNFPDYNQSTIMTNNFYPKVLQSDLTSHYVLKLRYKGNPLTAITFNVNQTCLDGTSRYIDYSYSLTDFVFAEQGSGYVTYYLFMDLSNDFNYACSDIFYISSSSNGGTFQDPSFTIFQRVYSISDYMNFVKQNWDDVAPSVTDTNQNIAQSVSDIGTAQTFETGAFSDFDSSMTSSGLDTFSLSFASTPLLWCASIINTFYNNMPSGFQYLLMFVAFVGILVIVLNIAGRVVRRFGGD